LGGGRGEFVGGRGGKKKRRERRERKLSSPSIRKRLHLILVVVKKIG